jgi:hypothetical protein
MYYILNQNRQIVALDPQLLKRLEVADADEFYRLLALEEISFELLDNRVTISSKENRSTYDIKISPLSGTLGELTLIDIDMESESLLSESTVPNTDTKDEPVSYLSEPDEERETEEKNDELLDFDSDILFELKEESEEPETNDTDTPPEPKEEDDLFELILPTDADNAISEIENSTEEAPQPSSPKQNTPIYIDIESVSQKIGISTEDYNQFLNEYIDTALTLEEALQNSDKEEQSSALNKLSHLSNVLHLPLVNDLLEKVRSASETDRNSAIESFFSTLGRLSTARFEETQVPQISEQAEEKTEEKTEEIPTETSDKIKPSIDLSEVKPIHFDFQLEEAAKDLSLPVELIEEFVNDFIVQAHEETDKMLAAYEKGDLETIQKIGHLLKGTSSNLRINPLSDTLYEIQFNEDINRIPELVKHYWGHFLSLENQIKLISK